MQQVDLTKFPNGSGWHIIHDANNMCYKIKSEKGQVRNEVFTQRTFAERAQYDYLEKVSAPPKKVGRPSTK